MYCNAVSAVMKGIPDVLDVAQVVNACLGQVMGEMITYLQTFNELCVQVTHNEIV